MTYNIRAGNGDLSRIAATIRSLSPEIVGLQEVDANWGERSGFQNQPIELARLLGMHVRFAPIYHVPDSDSTKPPREFGVAVLSKFPVVEWQNHMLTRHSTQIQNAVPSLMPGLLEVTFDIGGRRVRVFNTHLDYRADPAVRARQVKEMADIIGDNEAPTIVLGDFNAPPDAPELQPLFARWRDAWASGTGSGWTYPANEPTKRIDYVLTSIHFRAVSPSVPATQSSDHRPVIADLQWGHE